jgi:hypothetical protein
MLVKLTMFHNGKKLLVDTRKVWFIEEESNGTLYTIVYDNLTDDGYVKVKEPLDVIEAMQYDVRNLFLKEDI